MTVYLAPVYVFAFMGICYLIGKWQGSKKSKVDFLNMGPEHNGSTVTIPIASQISVTLDDIPTTGYIWELIDHADGVLNLMGDVQRVGPKSIGGEIPVGGTGKVTYNFWAMRPGVTSIRLRLRRPWMAAGTDPYETSFICTVNVIQGYGTRMPSVISL